MEPSLRIVTRLPLTELWNDNGDLDASPIARVGKQEIVALLTACEISFVVADAGLPLGWIPNNELYSFWRNEVQSNVVEKDTTAFHLKDYPGEFCYIARPWKLAS